MTGGGSTKPGREPPALVGSAGDPVNEALLAATSSHERFFATIPSSPEPYRPGARGWIKVKHRHYWRFGQERERAQRRRAA